MSIVNKHTIYNYGLINLKDFPRTELIKTTGNKEIYKVPDDIEVLTIWNGKEKWVKPESFSIHKNLNMLKIRTNRGNSIECSDDHSLVTVNNKLEYIRSNPTKGMTVPKLKEGVNKYVNPKNYKRTITYDNVIFKLNEDLGYVFGAIIGDGWVNHSKKARTAIMLASQSHDIRDKITKVLRQYGYTSEPTTISSPHTFKGYECYSEKHTWHLSSLANMLREEIGHMAINKKLPNWWVNTSPGFRWGILAGLMDTDGTFSISKENRININYATISYTLAYDVSSLLHSLGLTNSVTAHIRKEKKSFEYTISVSIGGLKRLQKRLKLFHPEKIKKLDSFTRRLDQDIFTLTPNIPKERFMELRNYIGYSNDKLNYYRLDTALRWGRRYNYMPTINRVAMREIIDKYPEFFIKDEFWKKYKEIVLDDNIEWEMITDIAHLPDITEAYDLTVPPYNTFVLHNGIVVYDTMSMVTVCTDEAIKEIKEKLASPTYYLGNDNSIVYSNNNGVIEVVLKHMTT